MKLIVILLALFKIFFAVASSYSVSGCAPVGSDCSSCGYGYLMCSGINQSLCYNPEIGQSCCVDGCICPSGTQCLSAGIECIPIGLPTLSLTSTSSRTVTVTSFVSGVRETLTLLPADSSSSITSHSTTVLSTTKESLSPCQSLTSGIGTYPFSLQLPSITSTSDSSQSNPTSNTDIVSTNPSGRVNASSESLNATAGTYPTISLTNSATTTPVTVVSGATSHSGSSIIQKSSSPANTATASYTGSSPNISSDTTPVSSFACLLVIFWTLLF